MSSSLVVNFRVFYPGDSLGSVPSYVDIRFTQDIFGNGLFAYDAWCADRDISIGTTDYTAHVYAANEWNAPYQSDQPFSDVFPSIETPENLDAVHWLINQEFSAGSIYTSGDVQAAIWTLLGDDPAGATSITFDPTRVASLFNQAIAAVENSGYTADITDGDATNDKVLVLLAPFFTNGSPRQPLLVTVTSAAIGDFVWSDTNADGVQGSGESGISGATVNLWRDLDGDGFEASEVLATTTTDTNGFYKFVGLTPGLDYQVQFVTPDGFSQASPADQGDDGLDSDAVNGLSPVLNLVAGEFNQTVDSGFYNLASLGDFVFFDNNDNGTQDGGDTPAGGVTVELLQGGVVVGTTMTADDGSYLFADLIPGDYAVRFTAPGGTVFSTPNQGDDALDSDADPVTGVTQTVTLESGENNLTLDAGLVALASLGDTVFHDKNADGIQDAGDTGISGATVTLTGDVDGDGVQDTLTTTTDGNGNYAFTGLRPGDYTVDFTTPGGFTESSPANVGGDDTVDSDGTSVMTTLAAGENDPTLDSGFYNLASLGDFVFFDNNDNGTQDGGDTPAGGVTVELLQGGVVVGTTTTAADGSYLFADLIPGDYAVRFTAPGGTVFSTSNQGDDALDSDADPVTGVTQTVTLESGENNLTLDAGLVKLASLGDTVFHDKNADGIQDAGDTGIVGATVTLTGDVDGDGVEDTLTTTTDGNGNYAFTGLRPGDYTVDFTTPGGFTESSPANVGGDDTVDSDGTSVMTTLAAGENDPTLDSGFYNLASLGDFVFFDNNDNGTQDGGDTPAGGVTVELLQGGVVVGTTTTAADGSYLFADLIPGDYAVRFTAPGGTVFSTSNQGDDALDSDADPVTGVTQTVTLESGENNLTLDAGLVKLASLGDTVFHDKNADGIQDAGDTGIVGATVTLTGDVDGDGVEDTLTTTTDGNGNYAFTGLRPGDYTVDFTTPGGFTESSPANVGGDDTVDSDGTSVMTTLAAGENDPTLDSGFYNLASLGDFVFFDNNDNGTQDGGDTPAGGVTVELLQGGVVVGTTTTAADGSYLFADLIPGDYAVRFTAPGGTVFSTSNQGDDALDSDADPVTGVTQTVTLESGENNLTLDAGLVKLASLGDTVFHDKNADGIQDAGDTGIVGATVTLTGDVDGDGDVDTLTTTTDGNGNYAFTGLRPGDYTVDFTTPAGFTESSPANIVGDDTVDSDGTSVTTTLAAGENDPTLDSGFYNLASLGDFVFFDNNDNGTQDDGDTPAGGVTVELLQGGAVVGTTMTAADGLYLFADLIPGDYAVRFTAPDGTVFSTPNQGDDALDSDADPVTGVTQTVTLESGENNLTLDAGLVKLASLGDTVFHDKNADGIQDAGDTGIVGATVTLTGDVDGDGDVDTLTATTVGDGNYAFTGLRPGDYTVDFTTPAGFTESSPANIVGDDTVDSDGTSVTTTLAAGENDPTLDSGFYNLASLGDFVFFDNNDNGTQDDGDTPAGGVTVELLQGGAVVGTTMTAADGLYLFADLIPGDYAVRFTAPDGTVFSTPNQGDDALDSDADPVTGVTQTVTLESGENNLTLDAGLVKLASLGDTVFHDKNADGIQDAGDTGIVGATVTLTGDVDGDGDVDTLTATTVGDGNYAFTGLRPGDYTVDFTTPAGFTESSPANIVGDDTVDSDGTSVTTTLAAGENDPTLDSGFYNLASLGDFVFFDNNDNGTQDDGDTPAGGVTVELLQGGAVVGTTMTAADGLYLFADLIPGDYAVRFTAPDGTVFSTPNQGDDALDSDADPVTGVTQTVTLESGENNLTLDAGLVKLASLGDTVFHDKNADGIQDAGDTGIVGATVTLTGDVDGDGDVDTLTATTVGDGNYAFTGLRPGDYTVDFTTPAGFTESSPANIVGDDTVDSDGTSVTTTLAAGENDPTLDSGFYNLASIGDKVFEDADGDGIQDAGEGGIANAVVRLYTCVNDAPDAFVAETTTGTDGNYSFNDLVPGDYIVEFITPDGYTRTQANVGGDGAVDSDATGTAGPQGGSLTGCYTLESGEDEDTVDAGFVPTASIELEKFVAVDGGAGGDCPTGPIGEGNVGGPVGGVDLGGLTQHLFFFANGAEDANWQSASKGFVGDVVVNGLVADERTSGSFAYEGTIYTNDSSLGAWQEIVDNNPGQAFASTGQIDLVSELEADLLSAFAQINGLTATSGYTDVSALALDDWNTQNGINETFVINVTSDFEVSSSIDITGDAGDVFILRWDEDADASNGYQGQVKFKSGGAINPLGDLSAANFIHVAGDINASGGGDNPSGLADELGQIDAIEGGEAINGGGFYTGYWLTTGKPGDGNTASLSNAIFVGGWYTLSDKFSLTSGTSGVHVCANPATLGSSEFDPSDLGTEVVSAQVGDELVFSYRVTNTSDVVLTDLVLEDDNATAGTGDDFNPEAVLVDGFNYGDTDQDGQFDPGEVWYFREAGSTAQEGVSTNIAVVTAAGAGQVVTDTDSATVIAVGESRIDIEKYVAPEGYAPFVPMVCETYGKPVSMTFVYEVDSDNESVSNTQEGRAAILSAQTLADADGNSFILVTDAEAPFDGGAKVFFAGNVGEGGEFTAAGDFGSSTYIHVFESESAFNQGAGLLQSLTYHTSCSKPINLGDETGYAKLVGYEGENGSATPVNSFGEDADVGPGPEAAFGSEVTFTYVVTNTGETSLGQVVVADDRLSNVTYLEGDDGDGVLAVGESWIYQATESALAGQVTNIGSVTAQPVLASGEVLNVTVSDSDAANYVVTGGPQIDVEKYVRVAGYDPIVAMVCETYGKAVEMTFVYEFDEDNDAVSNTQEGRAEVLSANTVNDTDGMSYIRVTDKNDAFDGGGKVYFEGWVNKGEEFTATAANADDNTFGSETFIHFFNDDSDFADENGSGLLQSIAYHTSCSKPINLGDETGYAKLVGYVGEDGAAQPLNELGEDADVGPGPEALIGSTVEFYYLVTNPGSTALAIIDLADDSLDNLIFVDGDDDGDGLLDVGEEWLYTASEVAAAGINTNVATVTATAVDDLGNAIAGLPTLSDEDTANYQGVDVITPDFAVCETFGKAEIIEFNYAPGSAVSTSQDPSKAGILFDSGLVDDDGTSWFVVSDKSDATDLGGKVYFNGEVSIGDDFLATAANAGAGTFGSGTYIHIFDDNPFNADGDYVPDGGDDLLQSMAYHTSCSQPIFFGDEIGGVNLVGYQGVDGSWGI